MLANRITNHQHGPGYHSSNTVLVYMRQRFPPGKWNLCYISRYEVDSNVFIRRLVFDNFFSEIPSTFLRWFPPLLYFSGAVPGLFFALIVRESQFNRSH